MVKWYDAYDRERTGRRKRKSPPPCSSSISTAAGASAPLMAVQRLSSFLFLSRLGGMALPCRGIGNCLHAVLFTSSSVATRDNGRRRGRPYFIIFFGRGKNVKKQGREFDKSKYQHWIDPAEVKPYERNAKIHTDKQVENIANSIRRFGWQQDTVLTADNVLVIGHGRRLAALKIGCEMPYHRIDKKADALTDADIRELRIADNQTNAETGMDFSALEAELADLSFDGFDFDFGSMFEDENGEAEEDTPIEPYTGIGAKEYDPEEYSDEKFRCECPRCGFKFNP